MLGRWLLYTLAGALLILMALGGGGELGPDRPKGSFRSMALSVAAVVMGVIGGVVLHAHRAGEPIGRYWPYASIAAWLLSGALVVAAWVSIGRDIRREARPPIGRALE